VSGTVGRGSQSLTDIGLLRIETDGEVLAACGGVAVIDGDGSVCVIDQSGSVSDSSTQRCLRR